ncbi:MAG: hypothetical protein ACP5O4_08290 [bacterium]|jgi:hypothetical protein
MRFITLEQSLIQKENINKENNGDLNNLLVNDLANDDLFNKSILLKNMLKLSLITVIVENSIKIEGLKIYDYLFEYPELIDVVSKVIKVAREYFPDDEIALSLYEDPEIDDKYVVIYVRSEKYDSYFMDKLENAQDEIIDLLDSKIQWICLTTDFKKPKNSD